MPNGWETSHFGSATAGAADADGDGDGYSNRAEYLFQTDPTNRASFFAVKWAAPDATPFKILFLSATNRTYSVLRTYGLTVPDWRTRTNLTGTGAWLEYADPDAAADQAFYRIGVTAP